MTIKDHLQGQIFLAMMYRKQLRWKDLDISGKQGTEVYEKPKVVECIKKMSVYESDWNCILTNLVYEPITES
jgi:hypothetical protein